MDKKFLKYLESLEKNKRTGQTSAMMQDILKYVKSNKNKTVLLVVQTNQQKNMIYRNLKMYLDRPLMNNVDIVPYFSIDNKRGRKYDKVFYDHYVWESELFKFIRKFDYNTIYFQRTREE